MKKLYVGRALNSLNNNLTRRGEKTMSRKLFAVSLFIVGLVLLVTVVSLKPAPESVWVNRDGITQLAKMNHPAPLPAPGEVKASPLEQGIERKSWISRDGLIWSMKREAEVFEVEVIFINGNPKVTQLGLVRFYDFSEAEGKYKEYELMEIRWNDAKRVIKLTPGHYGITQYRDMPGESVMKKIKGFKEFDVENRSVIVEFEPKDLPLPHHVI